MNAQSKPGGAKLLLSPLFRGRRRRGASLFILLTLTSAALSADPPPKAPVPPSPYLPLIYRFADTMIEKGRDTYGQHKTGLFLSALDRKTLAPLTTRPPAPEGVPEEARAGLKEGPLTGANLHHDENLLRLLYTLSDLSSKPVYRDAANGAMQWFLQNAADPATHFLTWGEHIAWDVMRDAPTVMDGSAQHEFFRPWLLWERCYEQAPEASKLFANALQNYSKDKTNGPPRIAGFYIRTWGAAYAQTKDASFLQAIQTMLERLEKLRDPQSGMIKRNPADDFAAPASILSLAIDCDAAARLVPEPLATQLRNFAAREDELYCALPHDLKAKRGFVATLGKQGAEQIKFTSVWNGRHEVHTTAQDALLCLSRYENTGSIKHRDLMIAAAESYLNSSPPDDADIWPLPYGHAISLHVAAWRHTARQVHLDAARRLADAALAKFFDSGPLPRASAKSEHYESITGADTLALALVELHLNILHITAVRCPPNTADR